MAQEKDFRKIIVDNAQHVFARFGLKKTTVDEIAATINKAKSSIYYYFKSKEDIFEAVIEKEATIFREAITNAISHKTTSHEKIKAYVLTRMRMFQKLANFYTTFQKEYTDNYTFISNIRLKYDKEETALISRILKEGVATENLEVKDVELTAFAILGAMKGFEYPWSLEKDLDKLEQQIDYMLDILFYGLMKRD